MRRRSYTGIILWWAWTSEKWYDLFCIWFYSRRKWPEGVLSDCWKLYWRGRFFPDSGSSTCRKNGMYRRLPSGGERGCWGIQVWTQKIKSKWINRVCCSCRSNGRKGFHFKNLYFIWYEGASGKRACQSEKVLDRKSKCRVWNRWWSYRQLSEVDLLPANFKKNLWMFLPSISRLWKRRKRLERSLAGLPCTSDYESLKRPSDDRG